MIKPEQIAKKSFIDKGLESYLDDKLQKGNFKFTSSELMKAQRIKDYHYSVTLDAYRKLGWIIEDKDNGAYGAMGQNIITFEIPEAK